MIDTQKKFLFIHIPKTAGTSITTALKGQRSHKSLRHYLPLKCRQIPKLLIGSNQNIIDYARIRITSWDVRNRSSGIWAKKVPMIDSDYKTFSVVRNPWTRVVSFYQALIRHPPTRRISGIPEGIEFEEFLLKYASRCRHLRPQMHWLINWDGRIDFDFIAKQENLQEDWKKICNLLELDLDLPFINASSDASSWKDYYTPFSRQLIAKRYREEINQFGYTFE
tara:strand:+ start:5470 stop:6138 length:669 start_codon:yes stop_codon:yes gene_type:complete